MENSTNVDAKSEGSESQDIEKVMSELNALKSSNERLLEESKQWKSKYQLTANEKSSIEKQKLEKEGNFEQLLNQEKSERLEIEKRLRDREKAYLKTQARALLAEVAKDAHDIGDLLKLDEVASIQYDEEKLEVAKDSVVKFVANIREKKPWMFGDKKIAPSANGKLATGENNSLMKSISAMSTKEIETELRKLGNL